MNKILYNTFYTPGRRYYRTAPGLAAVFYPGKPMWLRADAQVATSENTAAFFGDFLNGCGEQPAELIASEEAINILAENYSFGQRREITALFRPCTEGVQNLPAVGPRNVLPGQLHFDTFGEGHLPLISEWLTAFYSEALHMNLTASVVPARALIGGRKLYGLFDKIARKPLAMGMTIPLAENMVRLNLIYVPDGLRGKGLGKMMVLVLCSLLHEKNILPVLYVYTDNTAALNLYRSAGFTEAGRLVQAKFSTGYTNPG